MIFNVFRNVPYLLSTHMHRDNLIILKDRSRHSSLREKLLNSVVLDSSHKLSQLLSKQNVNKYNLRRPRHFQPFKATLYPKFWWLVQELKEVFELEEF